MYIEIKFRIAMASATFTKKKTLFFHQQIGLKYMEGTIEMLHIWHSSL
jgi:hypothetical protein